MKGLAARLETARPGGGAVSQSRRVWGWRGLPGAVSQSRGEVPCPPPRRDQPTPSAGKGSVCRQGAAEQADGGWGRGAESGAAAEQRTGGAWTVATPSSRGARGGRAPRGEEGKALLGQPGAAN